MWAKYDDMRNEAKEGMRVAWGFRGAATIEEAEPRKVNAGVRPNAGLGD